MEEYCWKRSFPISWERERQVTRREFTRSLVRASCAALAANSAVVAMSLGRTGSSAPPALRVAALEDLPVGGSRVFDYPEPGSPCLLVRLAEDRFEAFMQKCTHLGCPVLFTPESKELSCPCHEGAFSVEDGRVLRGPPPRPLPRVVLEKRGNELWAIDVRKGS